MAPADPATPSGAGFARVTARGAAWSGAQVVVGKLSAAATIVAVSWFLSAPQVGAATLATTSAKFLSVIPVACVTDVLIAHRARIGRLAPHARALAWSVAMLSAAIILASIPVATHVFTEFPATELAVLFAIAAVRPLAEALTTVPLAQLRLQLRNRTIATVDGIAQMVSAAGTMALLALGAGPLAVVLNPSVAAGTKAIGYARSEVGTPTMPDGGGRATRHGAAIQRALRRAVLTAGAGQYLHSVLDTLPLIAVAIFASSTEVGLFAFALGLAAQTNVLVAYQLGAVLQPVLSHLSTDPGRQRQAYVRALAATAAVVVPISALQAALAQPLFAAVFPERWKDAAALFAILSLWQGLYGAAAPTMAYFKAQGRFGSFMRWQGAQLAASAVVLPIAAMHWGATGAAVASLALWGIGLPIAAVVACRAPSESAWPGVLRALAMPWVAAMPVAAAAWWGGNALLDRWSTFGAWIAVVVLAPAAAVASIGIMRVVQPEVYAELRSVVIRRPKTTPPAPLP